MGGIIMNASGQIAKDEKTFGGLEMFYLVTVRPQDADQTIAEQNTVVDPEKILGAVPMLEEIVEMEELIMATTITSLDHVPHIMEGKKEALSKIPDFLVADLMVVVGIVVDGLQEARDSILDTTIILEMAVVYETMNAQGL